MPPAPAKLRVFVADDHPIVLNGIKALIAADPGFQLVGEASDGPEALRLALDLVPDVAVLDQSMPGMDGAEVARNLLAVHPACRVLMLSVCDDAGCIRELLARGIAGYVLKRSATDELVRGVRQVGAGGTFVDPALGSLEPAPAPPAKPHPDPGELSAREMEVLRLAAAGHSNKIIAARLKIGPKSVETYKGRGMAKLGFQSRVEIIRYALAQGWLTEA